MRKVTITVTDENGKVLAKEEGTVKDGANELVMQSMIPPGNRYFDATVAVLNIGDGGTKWKPWKYGES